jgi:hypothetical protein
MFNGRHGLGAGGGMRAWAGVGGAGGAGGAGGLVTRRVTRVSVYWNIRRLVGRRGLVAQSREVGNRVVRRAVEAL